MTPASPPVEPEPPVACGPQQADRTWLAEALADAGVEVPEGTHLLVGRVLDDEAGGPPGCQWFSLGDTGFVSSNGRFWPASTIKLAAAVSALSTLAEHGLDASTVVAFDDVYGGYEGTVDALLEAALVPSDNPAYNRLVLLAGLDALNQRDFSPERGFEHLVVQRFYVKPEPDASLRRSPAITWHHDGRDGVIPAREATGDYTRCPDEGNCVSLYELLEIVRRVVLHDELEPSQRFAVPDAGIARLRELLAASPSKFTAGVEEALGHGELTIYNKAGKVRGDDHLDAALIVDHRTGARWLLAASVPYTTASRAEDEVTRAQLERLAAGALRVVMSRGVQQGVSAAPGEPQGGDTF